MNIEITVSYHFLVTPIFRFALLPYYRRIIESLNPSQLSCTKGKKNKCFLKFCDNMYKLLEMLHTLHKENIM